MATVEQPLGEEIEQARRQVVVHFWRWLGLITASGLALRLLVVILSRHEKVTGDGYEWSAQGNLNAAGHWFVSPFTLKPDALRPPAWAMVLTIWAWFGQHSWLSQQVLGCLIGSVTVLLVGLCGRQLVGDRVGLLAAGIAAGYAGLWVYERAILSETLLLPEIALFILLVYRFRENPTLRAAAVLGGMSGLMAITRSEQVLTFPLVVLPAVLSVNRRNWRRAVAWLVIAGGGSGFVDHSMDDLQRRSLRSSSIAFERIRPRRRHRKLWARLLRTLHWLRGGVLSVSLLHG